MGEQELESLAMRLALVHCKYRGLSCDSLAVMWWSCDNCDGHVVALVYLQVPRQAVTTNSSDPSFDSQSAIFPGGLSSCLATWKGHLLYLSQESKRLYKSSHSSVWWKWPSSLGTESPALLLLAVWCWTRANKGELILSAGAHRESRHHAEDGIIVCVCVCVMPCIDPLSACDFLSL